MITMLLLINIQFPEVMQTYFYSILSFLTIDVIPISEWWTQLFYFNNQPLSSNFLAIGFSSCYFLYNMGSLVLIIALKPVCALICTLILKIKVQNSKVKNFIQKMKDNLVWNGIIGMIHENYTMFTICVLINLKEFDGDWNKFIMTNNLFVLIFSACVLVYPIALGIYSYRNFDQLADDKSDVAKKCGAHMKDFHKSRNEKCVTWFAKFRHYPKVLTMCTIFVFCQDLPAIQIISICYITLYEMIFVGLVRPHLTGYQNFSE